MINRKIGTYRITEDEYNINFKGKIYQIQLGGDTSKF